MIMVKARLPFQGFYESIHDYAIDNALEMIEENGDTVPDFHWTAEKTFAYVNAYIKAFANLLPEKATVKLASFHSPKEYNFETDSIIAEIDSETLVSIYETIKTQEHEEFKEYVFEQLKSCSGFIPFYSNILEYWPSDVTQWEAAQLMLLLDFYLKLEHGDEWEWSIVEDMQSSGFIDNVIFS